MNNETNDEVIVGEVEESNETGTENAEVSDKTEKPKRTPQEELKYFEGRAARIRKDLGIESKPAVIESKQVSTDQPNELTDGQIAILRTDGIKTKAEIALFKEVMRETGKTNVLDVLDSGYFKSRLTDFRSNQESMNAIPKAKNRSGQTGATDEDIAFAKFQETGEMPSDFKTRVAVKNKLVESEKSKNMFSGPSVIGSQGQSY